MHEEADKHEFISKFLNHIKLGEDEEIIFFNSKTSHIYFACWFFLFISVTSILFFPEQFPFYRNFLQSKLFKILNLSQENFRLLIFFASFITFIKSYSIWIQRKELLQSLYGLRILLNYMRVDEFSFFHNLKRIFPNLEDFEIADFAKAVFANKLIIK
ncbi:hypothetical protein JWG40_15065 [Leptospira sp. 201903074]|uniref:hypothetical protein n=1 Tax=Leptospira abararensis TaxID=2810036 RepID=UPI00196593CD|nr:hypothetical protein [Leptospira abararensis]MBM9548345.1 hypothetical protein [Leptospira abararensis]